MVGEGVKAFVRESYHLSYQLVNSWCSTVVDLVTASEHYDSHRSRIVRTNSQNSQLFTFFTIIICRKEEESDLQSVKHLLESNNSDDEVIEEVIKPVVVPKNNSMKKNYNTRNVPSKLVEKEKMEKQSKKKSKWWYYPLYFLYPILIYCFRFIINFFKIINSSYLYLWCEIFPNYGNRQSKSISSISVSTLPSDIDVNSESISGLLEDLQIEMFRRIHRHYQKIRSCWLAFFLPSTYLSIFYWLISKIQSGLQCLWYYIKYPFRFYRERVTSISQVTNQKWEELENHMNELADDYLASLEAHHPPTLYDNQSNTEDEEMITDHLLTKYLLGYPLEEYTIHTKDHYCIVLFRIPRPESNRIIYLQHGVMDTALAWVSNEPSLSLAIQTYLQGYDVFFGSFRGTDGHYNSKRCRNEILSVNSSEYWDFNIDDFILDYRSFIESSYVIKEKEQGTVFPSTNQLENEFKVAYKGDIFAGEFDKLDETTIHQKYTIMSISHSMGGAVNLAYIVESIISHQAHHLSNVVLLSPAGYLNDQSFIIKISMAVSPLMISEKSKPAPFPTKSSKMHLFVAKLLQDMSSTPATLDLVNQICASVIGGEPNDWPFQKVNYTSYPLGVTSLYTMCQFGQWYKGDEFTSYNYGIEGNQKRYGQDTPIYYTDYYPYFDVPIHFVAGKHDTIVPSTQVYRHYVKLQPILGDRTSYVEFENAGHLQFTIGLDHDVISYILDRLAQVDNIGYTGMKTEDKKPLCQFGFTKIDGSYNSYSSICFNKQLSYPSITSIYFFF